MPLRSGWCVGYCDEEAIDAEQRPGELFEVQLLDDDGRGVAVARYDKETSVKLDDVLVPEAVLNAGRVLTEESGDYVDRQGIHTAPF